MKSYFCYVIAIQGNKFEQFIGIESYSQLQVKQCLKIFLTWRKLYIPSTHKGVKYLVINFTVQIEHH